MLASIANEVICLSAFDLNASGDHDYTLQNSLFFVDFVLIGFMTYGALMFRRVEVQVMLGVGVFKDVKDMNDHEMF